MKATKLLQSTLQTLRFGTSFIKDLDDVSLEVEWEAEMGSLAEFSARE